MSRPMAIDTDQWASDAQIEHWRAMSSTEKLELVADLCRDVETLARIGIRRDHPGASEADVLWHLASRRYGEETAVAVYGPLSSR